MAARRVVVANYPQMTGNRLVPENFDKCLFRQIRKEINAAQNSYIDVYLTTKLRTKSINPPGFSSAM
jgi:hypothetical protein